MDRRDFIMQLGVGLAASWAFAGLSWPLKALGAGPKLCLALLADAHLKDGDDRRPEAQALARAVAGINALSRPPDLVLFAGDLAHQGRPDALDLGRKILSDLSAPVWAVRGEGDCGRAGIASWTRRFGSPYFSKPYGGVHFLGLDTVWQRTPRGQTFEIGPDQRVWLARQLTDLDSATPLVIVSHAPLAQLYLPWQQWTGDAPMIAPLLARFRQVLCLHGHTHTVGARNNANGENDFSRWSLADNQKLETEPSLYISLPATAWPRPQAVQGTPAAVRRGLGPRGCGWALLNLNTSGVDFQPHLWQA
jgi:3',5'-cyclic AMP phosphodiesterase CpdA